jgi:hypothetical protein
MLQARIIEWSVRWGPQKNCAVSLQGSAGFVSIFNHTTPTHRVQPPARPTDRDPYGGSLLHVEFEWGFAWPKPAPLVSRKLRHKEYPSWSVDS